MALSIEQTGKHTSQRHQQAIEEGKLTAGQAAKKLSKATGQKVLAKQLIQLYELHFGYNPEWHHSGFYKGGSGKSTMGKTWFFSECEIENLAKIDVKTLLTPATPPEMQSPIVKGFYYKWESDYGGKYGKKRNVKILHTYEGPIAEAPKHFVELNEAQFQKAVEICKSRFLSTYVGWEEPKSSDFE
jgi:hypothetical protein